MVAATDASSLSSILAGVIRRVIGVWYLPFLSGGARIGVVASLQHRGACSEFTITILLSNHLGNLSKPRWV